MEKALLKYQTALAELQNSEEPTSNQVLEVLLFRDAIQEQLDRRNQKKAYHYAWLTNLDKDLKKIAEKLTLFADLESFRQTIHPPHLYWWWFLDLTASEPINELNEALNQYESSLAAFRQFLENAQKYPLKNLSAQLINVLLCRDLLQSKLEKAEVVPDQLSTLIRLDTSLKKQVGFIPKVVSSDDLQFVWSQLDDVRTTLGKSETVWWWFQKIPLRIWTRFDGLWITVTVVWLSATFGLLTDISTRFLSGGSPGLVGSMAVIFQSVLALLGGGSLTKIGQAWVERGLTGVGIKKLNWPEAKFGAATLLLLFFIILRATLPTIAVAYLNSGYQNYKLGRLDSAELKYKKAIALSPDYARAHYNLGFLYEDLHDFDRARTEYNLAVQGGLPEANSSLARLYILSGEEREYNIAANLLLNGLASLESENQLLEGENSVRYSLLKNLGWLRFQQKRYEQAKQSLETAIEITQLQGEKQPSSAHCLLAQVLEKINEDKTVSLALWENCYAFQPNHKAPEEDEWLYTAEKKLREEGRLR